MKKFSFLMKHGSLPPPQKRTNSSPTPHVHDVAPPQPVETTSDDNLMSVDLGGGPSDVPAPSQGSAATDTDHQSQYRGVLMLIGLYSNLLTQLKLLDKKTIKFLEEMIKVNCSFESVGIEFQKETSTRGIHAVKSAMLRQFCEEIMTDVAPRLSASEQTPVFITITDELAKLAAFKKNFVELEASVTEQAHYSTKIDTVTAQAEQTQVSLGVDPTNDKLVKANEKAQERNIRNHQKLEEAANRVRESGAAFAEAVRNFERTRGEIGTCRRASDTRGVSATRILLLKRFAIR